MRITHVCLRMCTGIRITCAYAYTKYLSIYRLACIDDHNHYIIYAQLLVHKAALRHQSFSAGCPLHSGKKSILFKL